MQIICRKMGKYWSYNLNKIKETQVKYDVFCYRKNSKYK